MTEPKAPIEELRALRRDMKQLNDELRADLAVLRAMLRHPDEEGEHHA